MAKIGKVHDQLQPLPL